MTTITELQQSILNLSDNEFLNWSAGSKTRAGSDGSKSLMRMCGLASWISWQKKH